MCTCAQFSHAQSYTYTMHYLHNTCTYVHMHTDPLKTGSSTQSRLRKLDIFSNRHNLYIMYNIIMYNKSRLLAAYLIQSSNGSPNFTITLHSSSIKPVTDQFNEPVMIIVKMQLFPFPKNYTQSHILPLMVVSHAAR